MWTLIAISAAAALVGTLWETPQGLRRLRASPSASLPPWFSARDTALAPRTRIMAGVGAAVVVLTVVGVSVLGLVLGAAVALAVYVGLTFFAAGKENARRLVLSLELPDALDLMASCLAAGAPIAVASREVARVASPVVAEELQLIMARCGVGDSDASAWSQSRERPVIGPVARDVARAAVSGTALTACLRRHASEGRRERQAALEARAKAVGISAVLPMSVCFLPAFVLVGIVPIIAGIALTLLR